MGERLRLDEAIERILDAIVERLGDQTGTEGLLAGVEEIVRGDRTKGPAKPPSIWVYLTLSRNDHPPRSLTETWTLPVVLQATVRSQDPEGGYREATKLAARARSTLLLDRTLGLRGFVQDTRSSQFEPSSPEHREGALFAAFAVCDVIASVLEP